MPNMLRTPVHTQQGGVFAQPMQACGLRTKSRLGRDYRHRLDMLRNMVTSLLDHERIKTTEKKAKECARLADRMVTQGKKGTLNNRRQAAKYVRSRSMLAKLFTIFADRYAERSGGYTRVLKTYPRIGDGAPMAYVEMVDRPINKQPFPVPEEHSSVVPGRGGRKWRVGNYDLRNEIKPGRMEAKQGSVGPLSELQLPNWKR
uniref:50S ribosomal protein L17 n=1 Tax=Haptolina ericina TaxID=156174 RepID=A0A7S3BLN3_9EUKA